MKLRKILAAALALALAAAAMAGCGSAGGGAQTTAQAPAEQTEAGAAEGAATGAEAEAPAAGGQAGEAAQDGGKTLVVGEASAAGKFMPVMHDSTVDAHVDYLIFEPLMSHNESGEFFPFLAERMDVSEDGLTLTFPLKEGIKFSDGTPLTSADVEFTYRTMADKDYNGPRAYAVNKLVGYEEFHSGATDDFAGVKALDDLTIEFTFTEGNASPVNVEFFNFGIMSKDYYAHDDWDGFLSKLSQPMGSGPFTLTEYAPKQWVRLARNEGYWDASNPPRLDGILIQDIPEETMLAALQTGQVDLGTLTCNQDNVGAIEAMPDVDYEIFQVNGYEFLYLNNKNGIFDDARARQAMIYALDRKALIQTEFGGLTKLAYGPIGPVSWAGTSEGMEEYDYDLDKAAALLAEAGWAKGADGVLEKDGKKFSIRWLTYSEAPWTLTLANMAADSFKQLGVDLAIEQMDKATVISNTISAEPGEKDFDIAALGLTLGVDPDPSGGVFDGDSYSAGGLCASGYYNEEAQELIRKGLSEFDQDKRAEYYREWGRLMNREVPNILICYRSTLWANNKRVTGLHIGAYTQWTYRINEVDIAA